ncbi:L-histidine N(alpha)-methyltransferase [Streptomyces sp. NBC_00237]|uniref:L-histidine N(alpha)-methyltransferase n=1 Tax=Streptomyces sp. NBC_00237 TaxID=2975687 RepID=UPI002251C026|nr:L-histidine N(alpha)-methyltransferase [Streptomyces sp. NBC_00237]MCX5203192.1 L-histidine N(alpha)-methyltransferase [Streptomyces sp. NBC_00237]
MPASSSRLKQDEQAQACAELVEGLLDMPHRLPYWLLWDDHNTALYDRIREQPEYYLNRLETQLLRDHACEVVVASGARTLLELGPGTGEKALPLLRCMADPVSYVPVDVSGSALSRLADRLAHASPRTAVRPEKADFTRPWPAALRPTGPHPLLAAFLGGTLGNLLPAERRNLLGRLEGALRPGDTLLLGVPLLHDPDAMMAAYHDAAGLMATFYRHCLHILNRDFGTDFDLGAYAHHVTWAAREGRVEIGLRAASEQQVLIPAGPASHRVDFARGDVLRAVVASRFTAEQLDSELAVHGFETVRLLPEASGRYALLLARRRG